MSKTVLIKSNSSKSAIVAHRRNTSLSTRFFGNELKSIARTFALWGLGVVTAAAALPSVSNAQQSTRNSSDTQQNLDPEFLRVKAQADAQNAALERKFAAEAAAQVKSFQATQARMKAENAAKIKKWEAEQAIKDKKARAETEKINKETTEKVVAAELEIEETYEQPLTREEADRLIKQAMQQAPHTTLALSRASVAIGEFNTGGTGTIIRVDRNRYPYLLEEGESLVLTTFHGNDNLQCGEKVKASYLEYQPKTMKRVTDARGNAVVHSAEARYLGGFLGIGDPDQALVAVKIPREHFQRGIVRALPTQIGSDNVCLGSWVMTFGFQNIEKKTELSERYRHGKQYELVGVPVLSTLVAVDRHTNLAPDGRVQNYSHQALYLPRKGFSGGPLVLTNDRSRPVIGTVSRAAVNMIGLFPERPLTDILGYRPERYGNLVKAPAWTKKSKFVTDCSTNFRLPELLAFTNWNACQAKCSTPVYSPHPDLPPEEALKLIGLNREVLPMVENYRDASKIQEHLTAAFELMEANYHPQQAQPQDDRER